jgi:hypothetical protein
MVMQELNLLPTLTVAENLFLDNLPSHCGWISRKQLRKAAIEAMAQVGLDAIDPDTWSAVWDRPSANGRDRPQPDRRLPCADPRRTHGHADRP